jgi:hypothetical protein
MSLPAPSRRKPLDDVRNRTRLVANAQNGPRDPRYTYHRTRQMLYERGHPDDPWLTPAAIRLLESLLRPADLGAEFGSGRSTIWFAKRVAAPASVEHDERWYKTVAAKPEERQLATVEYIVARPDQAAELGAQSMYARTARGFPDAGLDFALIDGNYRDYSAKMDNSEDQAGAGYSSSTTLTGICHQSHGHRIRIPGLSGPHGKIWAEVAGELAQWRSVWTS